MTIDSSDGNWKILRNALILFSVGTLIFMAYLIVDNHREWKNLRDKIDLMETQLSLVEDRHSVQTFGEEEAKVIKQIASRKRICDREYAVLNLMKNINHNVNANEALLSTWNEVPYPFIHLNASATFGVDPEPLQKNVEGMHTVTGWNVMNVEKCTDSNPKLENHNIIIPMDGNYYIHSQITFKCGMINDHRPPSIHRHVVQYIQTIASYHDRPHVLMESSYQLCGKDESYKKKYSHQAGVFSFTEGDMLSVLVQRHEQTELHVKSNADASFGLYLL